jgi:glycine hydroxymethyltransferase
MQGGPLMHVVAGKAISFFEALQPDFALYAQRVLDNAKVLSNELMSLGCKLVTNGTDNHLMVVDVQSSFGINGAEAESILDSIGLTLNKNAIPDDQNPPFTPSGIRLGTPAITTRGASAEDMKLLASWIVKAIQNKANQTALDDLATEIRTYSNSLTAPDEL